MSDKNLVETNIPFVDWLALLG
ncbi:hypothetical protein NITGR_590071 [Nitrospina gracilis 3/211]|uniref:Uncharacterized protein n=1 Tax=Nitrospina gracilis (strain 3/211) TaxID=1266370 RepID=M1YZQ4_NITG3|nr:hypothetical protein NITGR_590071 [Nitrospina gracilis 3/211]